MRQLLISALSALLTMSLASANPMPTVDYQKLINDAELICAGQTGAIRDAGKVKETIGGKEYEVDRKLADVQCARVHKGQVKPGSSIQVEFRDSKSIMLPGDVLMPNTPVVLFLAPTSEAGVYKGVATYRWVQIIAPGEVKVDSRLSTREKVEAEMMSALLAGNAGVAEQTLTRLYEMDSKELLKPVKAKDPRTQAAIDGTKLALRIKHGDDKAIDEVANFPVFQQDGNRFASWQARVMKEVGGAKRKSALPALHRLMRQKNSPLRLEVSEALKDVGDDSSIPVLVEGLDDSNPDAAMNCLSGLSRITKRPGPGFEEFQKNRSRVGKEWKDWLKKRPNK